MGASAAPLAVLLVAAAPALAAARSAAFVGNSYTFYQDLPGMIESIVGSVGEPFGSESNTPGGSALWEHADPEVYGEETGAMLARESWDFVVLQDQSQSAGGGRVTSGTPLPLGECKRRALVALGEFFAPRLGGARPVLYSSWGRRDGDTLANPDIFPDFLTMNRLTSEGYGEYQELLRILGHEPLLVPAGAAFEEIHRDSQDPSSRPPPVPFPSLYFSAADGSHPSVRGTYLVALLFYGVLWETTEVAVPWRPLLVTEAEAVYLQAVAERTLLAAAAAKPGSAALADRGRAPRTCTTCRAPVHSWKTIPVSIHTSRRDTGPTGEFSPEDLAVLAKAPLVTIEKWQGSLATDASNRSVFLWEEDAMIAAAKQIKAANPATSVAVWFDTILVYTGCELLIGAPDLCLAFGATRVDSCPDE